MTMPTPLFIVLEGTDGSGISTQTARLAAWLGARGHAVHATKEPSGGPVGLLLRLALTHRLGAPHAASTAGTDPGGVMQPLDESTMALLFAADRADHLAVEVLPRLAHGTAVVCDRYTLSTYAYQGLSTDVEWLRALNARARVPDLTVLLDVPPAVSIARMQARGRVERYEQHDTLARVRDNFHRLVPVLRAEGQHIVVVDATVPVNDVSAAIVAAVEPLFTKQVGVGAHDAE